jgi:hypothetical protein
MPSLKATLSLEGYFYMVMQEAAKQLKIENSAFMGPIEIEKAIDSYPDVSQSMETFFSTYTGWYEFQRIFEEACEAGQVSLHLSKSNEEWIMKRDQTRSVFIAALTLEKER